MRLCWRLPLKSHDRQPTSQENIASFGIKPNISIIIITRTNLTQSHRQRRQSTPRSHKPCLFLFKTSHCNFEFLQQHARSIAPHRPSANIGSSLTHSLTNSTLPTLPSPPSTPSRAAPPPTYLPTYLPIYLSKPLRQQSKNNKPNPTSPRISDPLAPHALAVYRRTSSSQTRCSVEQF